MHYWTITNSPPAAISLPTRYPAVKRRVALGAGLLLAALLSLSWSAARAEPIAVNRPTATPTTSAPALKPYKAVYTSRINGMSADMEQTLTRLGANRWQLRNTLSILWAGFEETAQFVADHGKLIPQSYKYDNRFSRKRNSALTFDWSNSAVTDALHANIPFTLPADALDKLSFQAQLRLDLLRQKDLDQHKTLTTNTYHLVDRTKYKTYHVKYLGDERIATPAGTFRSIKIEQRRPGKDKYTLIWLAVDWDYFVLRIQRIEDGKSSYQVDLKQADINGAKMASL